MAAQATMLLLLAAAGGAAAGALAARAVRGRARAARDESAAVERERLGAEAATERQRLLREAEILAREEAVVLRAPCEAEARERHRVLATQEARVMARAAALEGQQQALGDRWARLAEREAPIVTLESQAQADRTQALVLMATARERLERAAEESADGVRAAIVELEIEGARGAAAHLLRQLGEGATGSEHVRRAKRIMGISVGRFSGHYLTERHLSFIPLGDGRGGRVPVTPAQLQTIETAAGIKLSLTEEEDGVRLEGLDGIGRELARRCLAVVLRRPTMAADAVGRMAKDLGADLRREIVELGRRAFTTLEIVRAHPDIVELVGRLNWRTSYTQNQWKHAVEAAFLCGMMADELGLDRKVARRAALMHDIGKALTHELDGSHAVIGADYARRLGESELVSNAIGAHHTDEPFSSPYAYLVAAADAMSGARPGARRQSEVDHVAKVAELERLSRNFEGVEEAFAVQGGREVRVYVREDRVDDLGAVALSGRIAEVISRELTFPGQIKITVIREFRAIETAS